MKHETSPPENAGRLSRLTACACGRATAKRQRRAVQSVPHRNQSPTRRLASYQSRSNPMDDNRMSGVAKNFAGKMEEGFGRATGDGKTRVQGQMRQAEGSIQDLYGQAVDSTEDAIE